MKLSTLQINTHNGECHFSYRPESIGDKGVIKQIFHDEDYNFKGWAQGKRLLEYYEKISGTRAPLIIDAGANIGASAVYFSIILPNSFVFSIEPDERNFHLLEKNTTHISSKINFHGAISNIDGELILNDPGLSDWGFRTKKIENSHPTGTQVIKAICPETILGDPRLLKTTPLILKIDIEGGEAELFEGETKWLDQFPLVIIELHDWMLPFSGSSRSFIKAVASYDFDFLYKGENIFLFNRRILL
jgi:FkbM family methyltransferase